MRRRIYIDPSGLSDVTGNLELYQPDGDPLGALYDDGLWQAYRAAKSALTVLERTVIGRIRGEPYDDAELRYARQVATIIDRPDESSRDKLAAIDAIREHVIAHAATLEGDG